jgi:hypothetical protein
MAGASRRILGGGTVKPSSWGRDFPGRGGDTGEGAFFLKMTGLQEFLRQIGEDFKHAKEDAAEALRESLYRRVVVPSLVECPIDTGALRASVWWDADVQGGWIRGAVGYDTDYAVQVHERMVWHAPPTKWKYLEDPFTRNADLVAQDVYDAVVEALS